MVPHVARKTAVITGRR